MGHYDNESPFHVVDKIINPRARVLIGPADMVLTANTLPRPEPHKLCCKEKAEIVLAYRAGLLTLHDIERQYGVCRSVLFKMEKALCKGGLKQLKTIEQGL